jgi:peptide/nickel transport system permease protein
MTLNNEGNTPLDDRQRELTTDLLPDDALGVERVENAIELKEVEGLSQGRIVFRRFVRHKGAMISAALLFLIVVLAFSSIGIDALGIHTTGWWPYGYNQINAIVNNTNPTFTFIPKWLGGPGVSLGVHPFGQDEVGSDIFAEVMRGMQQSLMIIFVVGIVSTILGTVIGSVAGFYRGWIDSLLMRLTDLVIIVPLLLLAAILGKSFGHSGSFVLAVVIGFLIWTSLARLVRGEVLALREREFVDAARVAGAGSGRIIFRHILPNSVGVIIVSATLVMSSAILLEAALSFLGLGVQAPDVSLGSLLNHYQTSFTTRPWLFWWPGAFIVIISLTINFIGDGLRDAFDPRQKRMLNRKAKAAKVRDREKPVTSQEA